MSIINEALKKATKNQQGLSVPAGRMEDPSKGIEIEFQKKRGGINWGPIFVLLVLILITGPIVAPFFSTPFKRQGFSGPHSAPSQTQRSPLPKGLSGMQLANSVQKSGATRKAQFAIEEFPATGSRPAPSLSASLGSSTGATGFLLSGIVYSSEESYCIINDKIVKVGEHVSGARLVQVTPNEAILDYQGRQITLYA